MTPASLQVFPLSTLRNTPPPAAGSRAQNDANSPAKAGFRGPLDGWQGISQLKFQNKLPQARFSFAKGNADRANISKDR